MAEKRAFCTFVTVQSKSDLCFSPLRLLLDYLYLGFFLCLSREAADRTDTYALKSKEHIKIL